MHNCEGGCETIYILGSLQDCGAIKNGARFAEINNSEASVPVAGCLIFVKAIIVAAVKETN